MSQSKKISFKKPQTLSKSETRSSLGNNPSWNSVNDLRGSKSLEATGVLEAEYIKSLQQQIYLLELENNHLRQQTLKATDLQPRMTAEAEVMLENLKVLQKKVESLELELFRKEGHVDLLNKKIGQLSKKLEHENDKFGREKTLMLGDSMNTRKDVDHLERELSRKNIAVTDLKDDLQRNSSNLQAAENKVELLRSQLQDEMAKARETEMELAEKKSELLQVDSKLREMESRYISTNNSFHDGLKKELKDEIAYLKDRLSETSNSVEREQILRQKMSEDASQLLKENSVLNRQIIELQNVTDKERSLRERFDQRRHSDSGEFEKLRIREKDLEAKVRQLQLEVEEERVRTARLTEEMARQDKVYSCRTLEDSLARKRLAESDVRGMSIQQENDKLRQDKDNLIEHIDNLQDELKKRERGLTDNQRILDETEARLARLESLKSMDETVQSRRWTELEQTIDALKSQAHVMASVTPATRPPPPGVTFGNKGVPGLSESHSRRYETRSPSSSRGVAIHN